MDKQSLEKRLLDLPSEINQKEYAILKANEDIQTAKDNLLYREDELRLSGIINGKNAEDRAAQLREHTKAERELLQRAENKLARARIDLNFSLNVFKAFQIIGSIYDKGDE